MSLCILLRPIVLLMVYAMNYSKLESKTELEDEARLCLCCNVGITTSLRTVVAGDL